MFLFWSAAVTTVLAAVPRPIAFQRSGHGSPVVLIHCLGGDRTTWREEAARLAASHTVLNVELPGHGASPAPKAIDFGTIAKEITTLMRREKLAPAIVIGHSIGGTIAAWTPFADPGAVSGVLIVDSSISPLPWPKGALAELRKSLEKNYEDGLRHFYARIDSGPGQTDRLVETAKHVPMNTLLGYLEFASTHSIAPRARELKVPVELLASDLYFDTTDPKKELEAAGYGAVPDFHLERVTGSKHWIFWDQPRAYASYVDDFIERTEKKAKAR